MMRSVVRRRRFLQTLVAAGAAMVLPLARAHEFFAANFTIIHPWTRASEEGATTAIICMTFEDVTETDRLIGVQTMVADDAEMGGDGVGPELDLEIRQGQKTVLSESGVYVRLVGLKISLEVAREYPMTLIFAKSGPVQATFTVDYARRS